MVIFLTSIFIWSVWEDVYFKCFKHVVLGSVGDAISVLRPDVYVSDDGGYTWIKALEGPHHYAILDSGGLLIAVEQNPHRGINQIKWVGTLNTRFDDY